ncbi:MAG: dihydroorotase [Pseudomonadota bacterium]|nr:dihydroorotase [Pseudomonadota bacterium]
MPQTPYFDLVIKSGQVAAQPGPDKVSFQETDIGIVHNKISKIGQIDSSRAKTVIDARGLYVIPGVIDTQVHFREPGNEHKEDIFTGTKAAVLGGVTTVFEMPNTSPPTTNEAEFKRKLDLARDRAWVNYAFFVGATSQNISTLKDLEKLPGCCGIKLFMGTSTGELLVKDDDAIEKIVSSSQRRMSIHCEDDDRLIERKALLGLTPKVHMHPVWRDEETALIATKKIVGFAEKHKRHVHILHVTTSQEMEFLSKHKTYASVECTPQHLTLYAPECYDALDTFAQMNPPIRDRKHFLGLWQALGDNVIDVLGSDHAPHTREEKLKGYPNTPSGMPGVQTLLPIMLNHVNEGKLSLEKLVGITSINPARLFGIQNKGSIAEGFDADLTLIDLKAQRVISNDWIASKCGWTPFHGKKVTGWPRMTIVNGHVAMQDDKVIGNPAGQPCRFN